MLQIALEAEEKTAEKRPRELLHKRPIKEVEEEGEEELILSSSTNSDSEEVLLWL